MGAESRAKAIRRYLYHAVGCAEEAKRERSLPEGALTWAASAKSWEAKLWALGPSKRQIDRAIAVLVKARRFKVMPMSREKYAP